MEKIQYGDNNFSVEVRKEELSRRLWVTRYSAASPSALRRYLTDLALRYGMEKIILPVRSTDVRLMSGEGFIEEGKIPGYFNGEEESHFLASFLSFERSVSPALEKEKRMLREISGRSRSWGFKKPSDIIIRRAEKKDALPMANLFRRVFSSYPTPVFDPDYLSRSMDKGDIFMVACRDDKIIAAAAAEIDREHRRAEMSDCATDPDFRGLGLNSVLLCHIEKECLARNIKCLFSLARASSYGMNLVLHRLGYACGGTLVNNCHIGGKLENMNIWVLPYNQQRAVI